MFECDTLHVYIYANQISFEVANEENLVEQIKSADAVYFSGGSSKKLLGVLSKFPNLGELLSDKTVAGESADGDGPHKILL